MFDNQRYMTVGIESTLPNELILFLWTLLDEMHQYDRPMDYLQVFSLWPDKDAVGTSIQVIKHTQERPGYQGIYHLYLPTDPITAKVYVIDDISHSTMLLAEEY